MIDVAVTPNRQDAMGVHGIARDLAAAGLGTLKPLDVPADRRRLTPARSMIRTEDPEGCPAFYGRVVRGVTQRAVAGLAAAAAEGGRPAADQRAGRHHQLCHASVYGRPLHVYDLAKLEGGDHARGARATARRSLALNGKTYTLDPTMTVIADDARRRRHRRHHGRRA